MPSHSRGFTLIEILVVMVIVAIIAGVAVLSLGSLGRAPPAREAAHKLAALTELASEQAVMEGRQYGLRITRHGYEFYVYDGTRWQVINDDTTFRARELDDSVQLDLRLEGAPVKLAWRTDAATTTRPPAPAESTADEPGTVKQDKPQIALLSSGEITPFKLTLSDSADPSAHYVITASMTAGVTLKTPDETRHAR